MERASLTVLSWLVLVAIGLLKKYCRRGHSSLLKYTNAGIPRLPSHRSHNLLHHGLTPDRSEKSFHRCDKGMDYSCWPIINKVNTPRLDCYGMALLHSFLCEKNYRNWKFLEGRKTKGDVTFAT